MEFVFVVPRRALFPECYPQGFLPFDEHGSADRAAFDRAIAEHGFFVERARAEREPEWKQVIPYSVVWQPPAVANGEGHVLLLVRSARGGDARLHHKMSIGVGGHVNPVDAVAGSGNPVAAGSRREIDEELCIDGATETRAVGLINDDSNAVGAVHVGLVQVLCVAPGTRIAVREEDVLEGRMVTLLELEDLAGGDSGRGDSGRGDSGRGDLGRGDLGRRGANLESWSRLLVPHLARLVGTTAALPAGDRASSLS